MLPENDIVFHVNDVHCVIRIIFLQVLQYLELNTCLIIVFLFVLNNLQSNLFFSLVIKTFNSYAERAFSKELLYLIPVSYMILHDNFVISLIVIIAKVIFTLQRTLDFLAPRSNIVYLRIVKYFLHFVSSQLRFEEF
jgi:hypothetical protein